MPVRQKIAFLWTETNSNVLPLGVLHWEFFWRVLLAIELLA